MANDKSTDTVTTSLGGDTALSQTKESAAKIDNSSETAKENGEKFSLKDEKKLLVLMSSLLLWFQGGKLSE